MEETRLEIEKLASGGQGLARRDGKVVLVKGALPGEVVEAQIISNKKDYLEAETLRVLTPHPARVDPICPLDKACGGCQLAHLDYASQPKLKASMLADTFNIPESFIITPSPLPWFYRDRARLHLGRTQGRLRMGYFAPGSWRLVPVEFCPQLNSRINSALPAISAWVAGLGKGDGPTPHGLEILAGGLEDPLMLILDWEAKGLAPGRDALLNSLELQENFTIWNRAQGRVFPPARQEERFSVRWSRASATGPRLQALPGAFTQVNRAVNNKIINDIKLLTDGIQPRSVLDLYAGLGNLGLSIAHRSRRVTLVEESPSAVASARLNLRLNQLSNVRIIKNTTHKALKQLVNDGEKFDMVLLDPPRAGARGLGAPLARLSASFVVYLSCHPATLARDMAELGSLGFSLIDLKAYDMFPQTSHLETLALFKA